VTEIARTLQLQGVLDRKPAELSGGQRQRVAMGRAMVREPKAFLMDEPLSNLDAKLRVQMRAEIAGLQRQLGVTTIYVTHDQVEALTMGDRVAVLKDGVLQQVDTPRALYRNPANVFVAGFIGSPAMNLFEGRITDERLVLPQAEIALPAHLFEAQPQLRAPGGRPVICGIRPENLHDGALQTTAGMPRIPAQVRSVEDLGAERIVHLAIDAVRIDSGDPDAVEDLPGGANAVARFPDASGVRAGDRIDLAVDAGRLHFFDPQTRLAL
jgi:multiple sugar transport system ATP-binding protein